MSATTAPQELAGSWTVDPVHSTASFGIRHMRVSTFRTSFKQVDATLAVEDGALRLTGRVPVESIDVHDENFRGHLLSAEFFDAANTPTIDFESTSITTADDGSLAVDGELTVKGITKPVSARGTLSQATNPYGQELTGIELETTLDRHEFGLDWNADLPTGGKVLSDDVTLYVHLEFKKS
jgi:polyisoprenoid-binding protein YceI